MEYTRCCFFHANTRVFDVVRDVSRSWTAGLNGTELKWNEWKKTSAGRLRWRHRRCCAATCRWRRGAAARGAGAGSRCAPTTCSTRTAAPAARRAPSRPRPCPASASASSTPPPGTAHKRPIETTKRSLHTAVAQAAILTTTNEEFRQNE